MKTTLLPTLLLAGLLFGSLAPAQAQTTLLKIDYQNATVFHVLDDGRLLLPTGAADGYVLTADSDGYATWQAASGTGGLSVVSSDATLAGDGTAGSPLMVAAPLELIGSATSGVIRGENVSGNRGYLGGLGGVAGAHSNGNFGFLGHSDGGVYGGHSNGHDGYLGGNQYGAYGENNNGTYGYLGGQHYGVFGFSTSFNGVGGRSTSGYGVNGFSNTGIGVHGLSNASFGVSGKSSGSGFGVYGENESSSNWGALGTSFYGVYGAGGSSGNAAGFSGDVDIIGTLSKNGGSFKIDHPLDPANKYLSHSFVESPDMMNVYNGNVVTDANGEAIVTLPDYFEALNRDFRYQLTVIGQFAQAIVAEKIQGNQFVIRTDLPNVEVSWQVTGIRQDAWAEEHRIVVEEDKPTEEHGFYLHPKLFGQPEERGIMWARDPEMMRTIQQMPPRLEAEQR